MAAPIARFWRKKAILLKTEAVYGTDAVPTGGANAVEVRNVTFTPMQNNMADQNLEQPNFGAQAQIPVGTGVQLKLDVAVAGSGTAGVAPAWAPIIRACGFAESVLPVALAGFAEDGDTNAIMLAADASTDDDAYKNMRVIFTGGTGAGAEARIAGYDGATRTATLAGTPDVAADDTTEYLIPAQTVYAPVSAGFESCTIYVNIDGVQHRMLGCRGNIDVALQGAGIPVFTVTMTGLYGGITDAAAPATTLSAWPLPQPFNTAHSGRFSLHGFTTNLYEIHFTGGISVVHRQDVIGVEDVVITDRQSGGDITIQAPLIAEKDFFTAAQEVELGGLFIQHSFTDGKIVSFDCPRVQVTDPAYDNKDNVTTLKMGLRVIPTDAGNDELVITVR